MSDFMSNYFGPLDKSNCVYFLIISAIFFVLLVISIFGNLFILIKDYKKLDFKTVTGGLVMVFNIFLAYFVNRLLYGMCIKSLA
jgi:hypothetical protein